MTEAPDVKIEKKVNGYYIIVKVIDTSKPRGLNMVLDVMTVDCL